MGVEELDPELPQIREIIEPFVPQNHIYLRALKVTREIISGLKYEIVFVMQNEKNDEIYCDMDVLEKPWLIQNLQKYRKITFNNCSLTNLTDDDDRMRFQYEINPTFATTRTELSQDELLEMEDQIVTSKPRKVPTTTEMTTTTSTTEGTTDRNDGESTLAPLNPSSKNVLDDFFNMNNYFPPPQNPTKTTSTASPLLPNLNVDAMDEIFGIKKVVDSQSEPRVREDESSVMDEESIEQKRVKNVKSVATINETALKDLEIEIKKVFSELFQSDPEFQLNIIALINRKDDSTAQKNYNYVISILANKLKDKIETFNNRRIDENDDAQQVTIDPINGDGDIRYKRSYSLKIWDLAEESLETLDRIDSDDKKRILIEVISVKPAGGKKNILKLLVTVADSPCQESSHEISECEEKIDRRSMKLCLFEVLRMICGKSASVIDGRFAFLQKKILKIFCPICFRFL